MEEIKNQLVFLLGSFLSGVLVMFAYEAVNIVRGLFRPGVFGKLVLDVLFFAASAICVFQMIFLCNHGTIRSFFVFAFGAGAVLYRKTLGTILSDVVVKVLRRLCRLLFFPFAMAGKKMRERKKRRKVKKSKKNKKNT